MKQTTRTVEFPDGRVEVVNWRKAKNLVRKGLARVIEKEEERGLN